MPTTNTTLELSKGDAAPTSTLQAALVTLASLADELPEMPDLNGMLVSVGLEKDPAVAISVFLLVFILALGACRAVCRLLRCPAAANRRRGLHRAVSTTDGAEDSDDSDAAPQPQRRRKRRPGQKQRAKVVTRNDRGMEADEEGLGSFSTEHGKEKPSASLAAAHALADSLLSNTASGLQQEPEEAEVEEATDSEAGSEAVDGEAGEAMDSEAIADRALKHALEASGHTRADEENAAKEKRAMESRIARLELALQGKQAASNALPGQLQDCDDGPFNFGTETSVHEASSSDDDDAMTMVPIATASRDQPDMNDKRQARLDAVLQRKREAQARKDEVEAEEAKQEARRALRTELLFIDNELDSMANAGHGGPSSHLIASKWLLELAYSKYPPRTFSAQRAKEELRVVRELRFNDAVLKGLKLLQSRYAPEKNTVAQHGAEWAVMAEEVAKHAFALQAGVNRSAKQGFANHGDVFSPRHAGQVGDIDIEVGEVEDAD
jgi:hypothetical protein